MNNAAWKLQHLMGSYGKQAQWVKVSTECSSLYYYIYIVYISFYAYYAHLPSAGSPPLGGGVYRTHKARDDE